MANTFVEYTGNGSTTNYSFTFEYIKEAEVKVTIDGTATTAFTFANATTLSFTTAPASGAKIRIYRETDVSSLKATFFAGSAIKAEDLNDNFTQNNFAVEEVRESTWDVDTETIKSNETWVSSDTQIATTAAMDARFQDEATETITSSETWPDNDDTIATTAAIDNRIDTAITNDIAGSDGVSITDDGDGTITVGLSASSVDFDRIKDTDIITYNEQNAGSPSPADSNIFTASAAARRFDTIVQTGTPSGSDWQVGKTWLQNDADKTLSVWDGDSWEGISSGGTFTSQAKVVYVDATNGNDANDGHRISRPKATIKAAVQQINGDVTYGDGSIVIVAPGVYQEACPIQIQKRDVAIVGTALRQCVIHPTAATETATMFEVNSGTYLKNLTFTGMKASGTRGATGSLWENATYGLPPTQGWNVAFYNNAYIYKSPYIQNCTNFSDSEIDNTDLGFYAGDTDKGRAGDLDSAPTGGGLLVDGSTPHQNSPLRSIVCDSYTHTGLDAPGIFVTNNGYVQATSSYAFFNHAHITCINGGQANLAASTSDFGRYGLIASGKSSTAIFTSTIDGAVSDGAISFNIDAPTAGAGWHGSATRPAGNQLVTVNSVTYPILSAVANGSGWTVTISRPDPNNRSTNLGVNGAISDGAAVSFFLRSMIASSGHTMEYVGSGTDYRALPENGGVPNDANQKIELDDGKIWTATTDQNGKFTIGGNQTDDPFFEVDQQLGYVTIPEGSIAFNLLSDLTPQLGGNLDVNGNEITSASNGDVTINPNGTGDIVLDANVGIGTSSPAAKLHVNSGTANTCATFESTDAGATINLTDSNARSSIEQNGTTLSIIADTDASDASSNIRLKVDNSTKLIVNSSGNTGIGTTSPSHLLDLSNSSDAYIRQTRGSSAFRVGPAGDQASDGAILGTDTNGPLRIFTNGSSNERLRIDSSGRVGIGTSSPSNLLHLNSTSDQLRISDGSNGFDIRAGGSFIIEDDGTERLRIDSSGRVGIGTSSPTTKLNVKYGALEAASLYELILNANYGSSNNGGGRIGITFSGNPDGTAGAGQKTAGVYGVSTDSTQFTRSMGLVFNTSGTDANAAERMRIDSSGNVGIGTSSPSAKLDVNGNVQFGDGGGFDMNINGTRHQFSIGGSEKMRIDSSGNVGIGTTSPNFKLDVNGEVAITEGQALTWHDGSGGRSAQIFGGSGDVLVFRNTSSLSERMRIDGSGRLLLGTTTEGDSTADNLTIADSGNCGMTVRSGISSSGSIFFSDATSGSGEYDGYVQYQHNNQALRFATAATERMRLTSGSSAGLHLGKTDFNVNEVGVSIGAAGSAKGVIECTRSGAECLKVGRNTNDGKIVEIRQGASEEGNISVSGSTVSYNGGHLSRWSQLAGGAERTEILRGSVLSNLDEMCEWAHAAQDAVLYTEEDELPEGVSVGDVKTPAVDAYTEDNEQLNRMKVSDVEGDPNVSGVFQAWDDDDDTYTNDFYCAMTGDFVIRIAQGTTVARGDLLMSAGDGTAKPQDDDIVRSKTIAKVISTTVSTTYADGSYCVPCVLMAC